MSRVAGPSKEAPAQELIDAGFAWEIADAPMLHHGLNVADLGHVMDLRHRDVIPEDAAKELLTVLLEAHDTSAEDFPYNPEYGEVYNSRERFFSEKIGNSAGWLHAGRPRREAARVALRLQIRTQTAGLISSFANFASTTAAMAKTHAETFMPDQTYLQQAQPSTFGHYLMSFVPPALRDCERLIASLAEVNQSPGGAGCVNGSRLLDDRSQVADLLGFDDVIPHTRDAMWQTDTFTNLLATCVSGVTNQSTLSEDLEIWSSQEFNYIDLAGPLTRASVLMPQKRNPYSLSIIRGATGVMIGRLTGFLAVVKSPSARSDNFIYAYGEVPRAIEFTDKVSALTTAVVGTLKVNGERMMSELDRGFSQSTDLAEYVMLAAGIDYRSAYLIVGSAVRAASTAGLRGRDITVGVLQEAAAEVLGHGIDIDQAGLEEALDPKQIVQTRTARGGAAPTEVRAMADEFTGQAKTFAAQAEQTLDRYAAAEAALVERARALL